MPTDPSLQERFAALERPFDFRCSADAAGTDRHLRALAEGLPAAPADVAAVNALDADAVTALLGRRGEALGAGLGPYVSRAMEALAVEGLHAEHGFTVLFAQAHLLDAVHRLAFEVALVEVPLLLRLRRAEAERELQSRETSLPRRRERLEGLRAELERLADPHRTVHEDSAEDPGQRAYLEGVAAQQAAELEAGERALTDLRAALPALEAMVAEAAHPEQFAARIVLFARGGYGRAEMSFSSDVDTGYGLDARHLEPAQAGVYHEFVLRVERLLQAGGLATAHQFFELGEDLSRFAEVEALHTIPSILEGRAIAGNAGLLSELQAQFSAMLPFEQMVRHKVGQFEEQPRPGLTAMDLKEDAGGLRSIQTPLWLLGMTFGTPDFSTVGLMRDARERGLLSLSEATRLLLALEFLCELRNFLGAAERYYYDREARESGFHIQAFVPNRVDDQVARLYLFRKQRFESMDAFDSYRLRRVEEVQDISRRLLERVLDRTLVHDLGAFRVSVHLGRRRIIAIEDWAGVGSEAERPPALLQDGTRLLELFGYVAASGYDLTGELKEGLGPLVTSLRLPAGGAGATPLVGLLSALMKAPAAHRAIETLFEINDPFAPGQPSLIGRFIAAFDETIFLLRRFEGQTLPLHTQILRSLAHGAVELQLLRRQHPELHELLQPDDILALKWSLLLQGLGRVPGGTRRPAQTAEHAAEVLATLGYDDPVLERSVRLLIEHHASVAGLARTTTYMDQALAQFFEIAGRSLVNATLLYLVNLAVLQAYGEGSDVDVASLRALFVEANQMLGEMRGFPVQERSLELINVYFERKKRDLVADTRLHLLLHNAIARGLKAAVYEPLERATHPVWARVSRGASELVALQREIVLGAVSPAEQVRLEERLLQELRSRLGREAVAMLTARHDELLSWFFAAFANRYLMASLPGQLAAQLAKFAQIREARVIVDVVPGPQGTAEGLLIYIRGLSRPHTRVAYAMSRSRMNIGSGKVNRVELSPDEHAYCYYFQVSRLDAEVPLTARDLELMIAGESPPELALPDRTRRYERTGVRVEFQGDDRKGYRVVSREGSFERESVGYHHLRVVLRDEPYLFYKVSRAFDLFDVEVQQALITTIGNQVVDYFYLRPEDYERLRASRFEEVLIDLVHSDLLAVAR